ncbi:MAG: tryptophan-rich sensory protein [Ruminococcaceae bacterium]|nr:tryptophan-rich sensory protein [Oscillospiraceae bacterium]
MKINKKLLIICLAIPLAVGGLSALLTSGAMKEFGELNQPPLSPPAWLFPVVWTILFGIMGYSLYLVLTSRSGSDTIGQAVTLFGIQLFFNFFWSIFFFNFKFYFFSFGWLIVLWAMIFFMILSFYKASKTAALINIPYLAWVAFAGYLNLGIAVLN